MIPFDITDRPSAECHPVERWARYEGKSPTMAQDLRRHAREQKTSTVSAGSVLHFAIHAIHFAMHFRRES